MLVLVVLPLVRVGLHSIACYVKIILRLVWVCLLSIACCLGGLAPCQGLSPLFDVGHGGVAPCQGLSPLYCMLVLVVLLLVWVSLHFCM